MVPQALRRSGSWMLQEAWRAVPEDYLKYITRMLPNSLDEEDKDKIRLY